jgi:hypothetical protein
MPRASTHHDGGSLLLCSTLFQEILDHAIGNVLPAPSKLSDVHSTLASEASRSLTFLARSSQVKHTHISGVVCSSNMQERSPKDRRSSGLVSRKPLSLIFPAASRALYIRFFKMRRSSSSASGGKDVW